jgi:hypothetical protein
MKAIAFRVATICLLAAGLISCAGDDPGIEDQLIGKWMLTGKTVSDIPVVLSDCEKSGVIEFRTGNACLLVDACAGDSVNSGWNYKYDMVNISAHLPAAYYVDQIDVSVLTLRRNDITDAGNLQVTLLSYVKKQD